MTTTCTWRAKSDDQLRISQLEEALDDAKQSMDNAHYAGATLLTCPRERAASAIHRAQFQDAFANQHVPQHSLILELDEHRLILMRGRFAPVLRGYRQFQLPTIIRCPVEMTLLSIRIETLPKNSCWPAPVFPALRKSSQAGLPDLNAVDS